jgi:enamine deaminase RidA (YjgF/YER057c/UK114 family)
MKKYFLNPPSSPTPKSYHHAVAVEGGRSIYLSGQVAFDAERKIVGVGDVVAQTRQAMRNLKAAVEAGGGTMSDIVQITTHVVNYDSGQLDDITGTIAEFFSPESLPANTLVGISSLSTDGLLIEIGGIAVTDSPLT